MIRSRRAALSCALAFFAGCSRPVISIKPDFDFQRIRRVAVLGFEDFPRMTGSGDILSSLFEKALVRTPYEVVERRQIEDILKEKQLSLSGALDPGTVREIGRLAGVDALILGTITLFTPEKRNIVYVDLHEESSEPIYEKRVERVKQGDKWVDVERSVISGYRVVRRTDQVPQSYNFEAEVGAAARMVDVQTGEIVWVGTSSEEGINVQVAAEVVADRIVDAVRKTWERQPAP